MDVLHRAGRCLNRMLLAFFLVPATPATDPATAQEALTISVTDTSVAEGDEGETNMAFTVTLSGTPSHRVRVQVTALLGVGGKRPRGAGTAQAVRGPGRDFIPFQEDVFFEKGASGAKLTRTVNVRVLGDLRVEPDETVILRVNNLRTEDARVALAGGGTRIDATGTITNDDQMDTATSPPARPADFRATAGNGQVTLMWTDPGGGTITGYEWRQREGANDWIDWTDIPGSGAATTSYIVKGLTNNTVYRFQVRAVNSIGTGAASDERSATPAPGTLVLSVEDASVAEGDEGETDMVFTLTLSGTPHHDVIVRVATAVEADNTATATRATPDEEVAVRDFVLLRKAPVFEANATGAALVKTVVVKVLGDRTVEPDETFILRVSLLRTEDNRVALAGGGTQIDAIGTILNDDQPDNGGGGTDTTGTPGVTVTPTALRVEEGGSASYTVVLDTPPSGDVTVRVGGASSAVSLAGAPLTFTTGTWDTPQRVTVTGVRDEDTAGATATLTHSASGGGYGAVDIASVTVAVIDATPTLQLRIDPDAVFEGTAISLAVTSDRALAGTLPVSLTLSDRGSSGFTADDIPGSLGPRVFDADFGTGTTGTVTIPTRADGIAEGTETYRVTLNDVTGYAVGRDVTAEGTLNEGPSGAAARANQVNAAVLPQVTGAMLSQTLKTVTDRIQAAAGDIVCSVRFGTVPAPRAGRRRDDPRYVKQPGPRLRQLLDGAAFTLAPGTAAGCEEEGLSTGVVWGRGAWLSLSGSEPNIAWDGRLWSAHLGADMRLRPDLLAGAAVSHAKGEIDAESAGGGHRTKSTHKTTLTSVHPYLAWLMADGSNLWVSVGHGWGEVRLAGENAPARTADLTRWSAAAGGRDVLAEDPDLIPGGVTRLAVKGEGSVAWLDTDAGDGLTALAVNMSWLRLALQGSYEYATGDEATLTPALEAGVRHDGGDVGQGVGVEVGAGVTWRQPAAGLTVALRTRMLAAHEHDRDEWGVSARVRLDPRGDGRGTFLTFDPAHGRTASRLGQRFDYRMTPEPDGAAEDGESRLEAEVGHGFGIAGPRPLAVLTPYAGLRLAESGRRTLRLGTRYRLGDKLAFGVEGTHRPGTAGEDNLMLRGTLRW